MSNNLPPEPAPGENYVAVTDANGRLTQWDTRTTPGPIESVIFDTTASVPHIEAQVHWNSEDGTLEIDMPGGSVHLQVGQELLLRAKNVSGGLMANGTLVYIIGGTGNSATIDVADPSSLPTACVLGMVTEDINDHQFGYVALVGLVRDVNTIAYAPGTRLWLAAAGTYSNAQAIAPDFNVSIGYAIRQHATEGIIFLRISVMPTLACLSDVFDSGVPSNGDTIRWSTANARWEFGP